MNRIPGLWLRPSFGDNNEALMAEVCGVAEVVDLTTSPSVWSRFVPDGGPQVATTVRLLVSPSSSLGDVRNEVGACILQAVSCMAGVGLDNKASAHPAMAAMAINTPTGRGRLKPDTLELRDRNGSVHIALYRVEYDADECGGHHREHEDKDGGDDI